ncbi:uncharacterized protein [Epargyreus clarus]|uniref:uncharacterized protein n=1 Tax=Epargyreus clarus TaxID=520877 RepID=UPI003C2BD81B
MNSTSSSEYHFSGPYQFGTTFPNILGNPFCSAVRQPLIYYAKIEEPFHGQQSGKRKDKSNYFMKAFRWYTQEHGSCLKNEIPNSQVNNGFAAWLDKKYSEYLKGSNQEGSGFVPKQPSTIEADGIPKKKKSSRKFGRKRSPWGKRHGLNSKENSIVPVNNPRLSFQYILQPQDLSRTTSECCQRTSRLQSTTTIISKDSAKCTKVKVKSKSLLSIYRAQGERENKEVNPKLNAKNVICECLKKDAGTQYETYSLETLSPRYCKKNREFEDTNKTDEDTRKVCLTNKSCQCDEQIMTANAYPPHNTQELQEHFNKENKKDKIQGPLVDQATSKLPKAAVMFTDNTNRNSSELQNLSVQTSDHSINLVSTNRNA